MYPILATANDTILFLTRVTLRIPFYTWLSSCPTCFLKTTSHVLESLMRFAVTNTMPI